jgi:hypothetical protein
MSLVVLTSAVMVLDENHIEKDLGDYTKRKERRIFSKRNEVGFFGKIITSMSFAMVKFG